MNRRKKCVKIKKRPGKQLLPGAQSRLLPGRRSQIFLVVV